MTGQPPFTVGFRGEFTPEEEDALRRAGFGVHRDSIQSSAVWSGDPSTATELRSRHVITQVDAPDSQSALRRVAEILGREPDDPIVAP
jgi:hypothetical protein